MQEAGFLAIWSDVLPDQETDYLHWLTREHTSERLSIEGFLAVRVFRALQSDVCRYFILYELASPSVLGSEAYLARLNAPTPWSQRIMPILKNFARGGGRVVAEAGTGQGAIIAALKSEYLPNTSGTALVEKAVNEDRIIAARFLETDQRQTSIPTQERNLRTRDQSFGGLLLVEGTDNVTVAAALDRLSLQSSGNIYSQVFRL